MTGPYDAARGLRCNPAKLLLDPYARAISGQVAFGPEVFGYAVDDPDQPSALDSAGHVPRSIVVDGAFDWTDGGPMRRRYSDAGDRVTVGPRSVTVLRSPRPGR